MRHGLRQPIRPNLFGIAFGIAGLAEVWRAAEPTIESPQLVVNALNVVAAALWVTLVVSYAAQGRRQLLADLRDSTVAPFVPLSSITAMLLAAALSQYAFEVGRALVVIFVATTIGLGGWMTGQWIVAELEQDAVHPGYFLPTVAGGLVAAIASAEVHLHALAEATFGIGMLCWVLLGSLLLNRLFFRPTLPAALYPTLAIEVAPPVVAGIAYMAITGGATNTLSYALAGYGVLMVLVQIRLIPYYARLRFSPGFWAFTFSYAATATDALEWIHLRHPAGAIVYATVIVAVITVFIAAIAVRSVVAIHRGQFFPVPPPKTGVEAPPTRITP
jgi:tellurite resistance protein